MDGNSVAEWGLCGSVCAQAQQAAEQERREHEAARSAHAGLQQQLGNYQSRVRHAAHAACALPTWLVYTSPATGPFLLPLHATWLCTLLLGYQLRSPHLAVPASTLPLN
jgi:hypothetical protein